MRGIRRSRRRIGGRAGGTIGLLVLLGLSGPTLAGERMQFWNLTASTVTELRLAPPGSNAWGPDQTANDPDGVVDADERLKLTGIEAGRYDVKLTRKSGGTCIVRNVDVRAGGRYAFSISEADLKDCRQ